MAQFDDEYKKLNTQQREAVDTINGPVLVIAGPGSGKTQLLSMRVAKILKQTDAEAANILCLTFTDSATVALRERLLRLVGSSAHKVAVHTFHSFGTEIIASYPEYFFNGATYTPTDEVAQLDILQEIFAELPHDDPLVSMQNGKYVRIKAVKDLIEYLKKAGLEPDNLEGIIAQNRDSMNTLEPGLNEVFASRVSKATITSLQQYADSVERSQAASILEPFKSLAEIFLESLDSALAEAAEENSTKPVTAWKNRWLEKDAENKFVFADAKVCDILSSVARIYRTYQVKLGQRELFDYSDMVLQTVHALRTHDELRFNVQERYQFVLVDEFQDTNTAQLQLMNLIADNPVHEGRPDIMVVGDDDQGIYKFQGAELSNMLSFATTWNDPKIITLVQNYRSGQVVLDKARAVITQADERLENSIEYVQKDLVSNSDLPGEVEAVQLETAEHEYQWVAHETKKLIDTGTEPASIAIIGRNHKHLERMLPHLTALQLPVAYERRADVLTEPHIAQLTSMARVVQAIGLGQHNHVDSLLSEVISYPFWGVGHVDLWRLSLQAYELQGSGRWLRAMVDSKDKRLNEIADFLLKMSQLAITEPMEHMLDLLIGSSGNSIPESADDDASDEDSPAKSKSGEFTSPYRSYYFSDSDLSEHRARSLAFLSSLSTLRMRLREYRRTERLFLNDFLKFVELYQQNELRLVDTSPYAGGDSAVNLMTAHKSKGLEFETVFLLNCQEEVWANKRSHPGIRLPSNLPISPVGDNYDDQLRLFFVGMTRTKQKLYLTAHRYNDAGRGSELATFLRTDSAGVEFKQVLANQDQQLVAEALTSAWQDYHPLPTSGNDKAVLQPLLDRYAMSVTHLNNFLDLTRGGPKTFLLHNMLRFPQAESPASSMGSAIHKALQVAHISVKQGDKMSVDDVLDVYSNQLLAHRLSENEEKRFLKRGRDALAQYLAQNYDSFSAKDEVEQNFRSEGVIVGGARLTGKIDMMSPIEGHEIVVTDFKTGSGFDKWYQTDPYKAVKSWKYRNQLIFYKILVENSRTWGKNTVNTGIVDFVEPVHGKAIALDYSISDEDIERQRLLIEAVWHAVMTLNFPDVSGYEQSISGIKQFEEDLIGSLSSTSKPGDLLTSVA